MLQTSAPSPLLGARKPRVELYPPHERTYGPATVDLTRRAGQDLDDWQGDSVDLMLGLRADDKWACPEFAEWVSRQNGKGGIGEARVLAGLFIVHEKLMLWSAHEVKTALEAFRRVEDLLYGLGHPGGKNLIIVENMPVQVRNAAGQLVTELRDVPIKVSNTNGKESFERLDTRQRLMFIARSKGSGRGFSGDLNVIDEAFAYTLEQQAALMPTLSARRNPQLVYLSSPPLDGESGDVMYNLRERAEAGGDEGLGYRDWGLAGHLSNLRVIDLGDRRNWANANPALGGRISEESVAREFRAMSSEDFARERLGIWPRRIGGAGGVIDAQLWAQLIDEASRRDGDVALAVDVTPLRDHASIAMYGLREDGLGHVQVVTYGEGVDWVVGKLIELKAVLDPVAIGLDPKGGAASLLGELEVVGIRPPAEAEFPARGDLALPAVHEVAQATGQFIDAVREKKLRHIGQTELTSATANAKTRPLADAVAWGRKQSDVDISPLVSATLARWAYVTRIGAKPKAQELTGSLMA
ncbi:terminase [Actinoplanes sp. NPDC049118]|uniref:terminase n=1 Tax=Actinoplanes sp. NPDC049118 TaxID=3155769 RepID=UPI0033EA9CBE